MPELIVFPDVTFAITTGFADAGIPSGTTVPTDRDGDDVFVLVRRVGGPSRDRVIDDATVTIEAWAATEAEAHDLCQEARAVLHALVGSSPGGVPIFRVQEFAGPAYLPDPLSAQPRYTMTASVTTRGGAPSGS